jgi:hypothetical protein
MLKLALLALLLAAPAGAVTITEGDGPGAASPLAPDPDAFAGFGPCGSGRSLINDGCSVAVKDGESPRPYGRFDPFGGPWIDSQDRPRIVWTVERDAPFTTIRFALTDAFDQPRDDRFGGESHFSLSAGDAIWRIASREANGTLHWLEVVFDEPTTRAKLTFRTRLNDGWGVRAAGVAPVPLPASALMLLGGAGLLAALRRSRGR